MWGRVRFGLRAAAFAAAMAAGAGAYAQVQDYLFYSKDTVLKTIDVTQVNIISFASADSIQVYGNDCESLYSQQRSAIDSIVVVTRDITLEKDKYEIGFGDTIVGVKVSSTAGGFTTTVSASEPGWIREVSDSDSVSVRRFIVDENLSSRSRTAEIEFRNEKYGISKKAEIVQAGSPYSIEGVTVESDIKVKPTSGTASECQPGYGIERSYDGIFVSENHKEDFYHSTWSQSAAFPVTLEYSFNEEPDLDYLVYYTRKGNGNFGKVDIYAFTESHPDSLLIGHYDFGEKNEPSRVVFDSTLHKVKKITFIVFSGKNGFVSCDEMEFYRKKTDKKLDGQLLEVFSDITCTKLKEGVGDTAISALPGYFARLARMLRDSTYDEWEKRFRIQRYEPYSNIEEWADSLMTRRYSNLDNPTGIYVEPGDSVIILVGSTHGHSLAVQCIGEETVGSEDGAYVEPAASGETHFLNEGVNKVGFTQGGMLFIMYTASPGDSAVTIHIPRMSGKVSGFFDLKTDSTDEKYAELLGKATYKYFCVRGERMIFYFHRLKMLEAAPKEILSAINLWDDILKWEQEMCGVEQYRQQGLYNNHMFSISPEGSYMWASDYRVGFVYTYLSNILLRDNVMAAEDNAWGPAHEIGHVHQLAINWPGCSESSNNLFSNYVIYRLGKYKSRGWGLDELAKSVYGDSCAWYNVGGGYKDDAGEKTEIHMRMYWQLWIYLELCKGTADNPTVWPKIFEEMRTKYRDIPDSEPGKRQMAFVKAVCDAAKEDLTEFFETWGFFKEVNQQIGDYGTYQYTVTDSMIDETKKYIADKHYPKAPPVQYIEDRKRDFFPEDDYRYTQVGDVGYYEQFQDSAQIADTVTYSCNTADGRQHVEITGGDKDKAVAFEIREAGEDEKPGKLLYFSDSFNFTVPETIQLEGAGFYAVQSDGQRIPMTETK